MYKILIAENNPTIARLLSHFFEAEGCDIRLVKDGLQAMITLDTFIPDILCTDIIMPKIGGDQLCRIIRNSEIHKYIFIVVHSAISLEDDTHLFEMGADLYIAKGPAATVKNHVHHILDQFSSGKRRENVLHGIEGLHPRTITRELLLSRRHDSMIFENLAEAVIEMDNTGKIVQANRAAQELLDRDFSTLLGCRLNDYLAGPEYSRVEQWFAGVSKETPSHFGSSYEHPLRIGSHQVLLKLVRVAEKDAFFIIAILQDITSLKETEGMLTETVNEFNAVMESSGYGILFMDSNLRARMANRAFREMWGISEEIFAKNPTFRDLISFNRYNGIYDVPDENFDRFVEARELAVRKGESGPNELRRKDGIVYQQQCVVLPDNGRMLTYFDITRHKDTEKDLALALGKVSDQANRDVLTGLPNMRLFQERFFSTLSISKRKEWKAAIMFIDLDGFKNVNDSFGHEMGDRILQMTAQRLLETVRKADTVARIGGDEFLIILTEVKDRAAAAHVAGKIVQQLSAPFDLDGNEITIGASIGIAMYPTHGDNSRDLVRKADNAMYKTKVLGKKGYTFAQD
jgi:diguanylate cyclase (GGDEF)-like protein/PAS domain S-box-containing protein